MKKLSFILAAFLVCGAMQAQISFDFEDGTLQGWTTIDADGDGHNWQRQSANGLGHGRKWSSSISGKETSTSAISRRSSTSSRESEPLLNGNHEPQKMVLVRLVAVFIQRVGTAASCSDTLLESVHGYISAGRLHIAAVLH